jgi:hypothetical protein
MNNPFTYTMDFVTWTDKYINTPGASLNRAKSFLYKDIMAAEKLLKALEEAGDEVVGDMIKEVKGDIDRISKAIKMIDDKLE